MSTIFNIAEAMKTRPSKTFNTTGAMVLALCMAKKKGTRWACAFNFLAEGSIDPMTFNLGISVGGFVVVTVLTFFGKEDIKGLVQKATALISNANLGENGSELIKTLQSLLGKKD